MSGSECVAAEWEKYLSVEMGWGLEGGGGQRFTCVGGRLGFV